MNASVKKQEQSAEPKLEQEDFYFTCSVLGSTLRASACCRNRLESSKVASLMLIKQSTKCKGCQQYEGQQAETKISVDEYHRRVFEEAGAPNLVGKKIVPRSDRYYDLQRKFVAKTKTATV